MAQTALARSNPMSVVTFTLSACFAYRQSFTRFGHFATILLRHRLYSRNPWWGMGGQRLNGNSSIHSRRKWAQTKVYSMALMKRDHRLTYCHAAALQFLGT